MFCRSTEKRYLAVATQVSETVGSAILVTGMARTGTTLLGNLLHSCQGVEYLFEPPTLYGLLPLVDRIPARDWAWLYGMHLFGDFLLDAIAGRRLNWNEHDESFIGRAKSKQELAIRLSRSWSTEDLFEFARRSEICYKMPDVLPWVPGLKKIFPETRVVVTVRENSAVVGSLLNKGWFRDGGKAARWYGWQGGYPIWLPEESYGHWERSDETIRCWLYVEYMNSQVPGAEVLALVVYEDLVAKPAKVFLEVTQVLGLKWGEKTEDLLASVGHRG